MTQTQTTPDDTDQGGAPATSKVQLDPNPAKMSPAKAKAEARQLREVEHWTVAELKARYGPRFNVAWLEGIPAPVNGNGDTAKSADKTMPKTAANTGSGRKAKAEAAASAEQPAQASDDTKPAKPSGAAGNRPDASKPKPEPRTVSKATAARQSVARAKAAKEAADKAKTQPPLSGDPDSTAKASKAAKAAAKTMADKAKAAKPKGQAKAKATSGTGVSGRTMGYKAPLHDNAVRLIRSLYGTKTKAEIIAAVQAEHGVTPNTQTIDKIGKRVSRKNVSDDGPTTNPDKPTTSKPKAAASKAKATSKK